MLNTSGCGNQSFWGWLSERWRTVITDQDELNYQCTSDIVFFLFYTKASAPSFPAIAVIFSFLTSGRASESDL